MSLWTISLGAIGLSAAMLSVVPAAQAQGLDDYLDQDIGYVKNSLRSQGFDDTGHISIDNEQWALMYDGETCIALHGNRGVIDDIDTMRRRTCEGNRRPRRR